MPDRTVIYQDMVRRLQSIATGSRGVSSEKSDLIKRICSCDFERRSHPYSLQYNGELINSERRNIFHWVAVLGVEGIVNGALNENKNLFDRGVDAKDQYGFCPIHYSALMGHMHVLKELMACYPEGRPYPCAMDKLTLSDCLLGYASPVFDIHSQWVSEGPQVLVERILLEQQKRVVPRAVGKRQFPSKEDIRVMLRSIPNLDIKLGKKVYHGVSHGVELPYNYQTIPPSMKRHWEQQPYIPLDKRQMMYPPSDPRSLPQPRISYPQGSLGVSFYGLGGPRPHDPYASRYMPMQQAYGVSPGSHGIAHSAIDPPQQVNNGVSHIGMYGRGFSSRQWGDGGTPTTDPGLGHQGGGFY